jgi:hypothetical protein
VSCEPIRMADGTVVLAMVRPGAKLTDEDREALAEWIQFCRDRSAREKRVLQQTAADCAGQPGKKGGRDTQG